jgi:FkbM family methyltransferase
MDHEDQRLLKTLLQADRQERLFKILETENFLFLNRGLEADQQRLLKGALRKDDHRLLKLVLTSGGNEIFRELASSDEGRFFARLLESENLQVLKKALSADNLRLLRKVLKIDGFALLEKMLSEDEALLLRSFFAADRGELFEKTFVADNLHLLKLKLREKNCELLKEVLLADQAALLHRLLEEEDAAILKRILLEEDSHLLKSILAGQDYRLLESAIMADDYRLLKRILHRHQAKALVSALAADGFALLEKSMDAEGGRLLVEALRLDTYRRFFRVIEQDNFALFKVLFQHREFLYPLRLLTELEPRLLKQFLTAANYRIPRELIILEEGAVMRNVLLADQKGLLKRFLVDQGFIREILKDKRMLAVIQFLMEWREVSAIVDSQKEGVAEKVDQVAREITTTVNLHRQIGSVFCEEDTAFLAKGQLTFPEFPAFWVLLHEILLNEDYFFQTKAESPRILDCGTHFGLSLYYFKTLFPRSRITAFEPVPALRELAASNMKRNGFKDVEILPYALSDRRETARFQISKVDTMAGSLTSRNEASGAEFEEIEVECRPLSEFLREPVNFLKLDIEGVEDVVIEEARDHLHRVEHIFVEYHQDKALPGGRLPRILEILNAAGFDTHLDKSYSAHQTTGRRPLTAVGKGLSLSIWGRNRNWKETSKEAKPAPGGALPSPKKTTKSRGKGQAGPSTAPRSKTPSNRK